MKKILSLVAIAAMMLAMAGCAVNSSTGSITVRNRTDKPVNALKVGSVFVGHVAPGATTTIYFFKEEAAAKISYTGDFSKESSLLSGTIDLKPNYLYLMTFKKHFNTGDYDYTIGGTLMNGYSADGADFIISEK